MIYDKTSVGTVRSIAVTEADNKELRRAHDVLKNNMPVNNYKELIGKTFSKVRNVDNNELIFESDEGNSYKLYYEPDCCASCSIEDIAGDLRDLEDSPILMAEEVVSSENPPGVNFQHQDSFTWTFYKFATIKGYVTVRWYGESNGYYSESVSFTKL